jgi:hypothetical protein
MLDRDPRFRAVQSMHKTGGLKSFNDIFLIVPKTVISNRLGKKVDRFNELMSDVGKFTLDEVAFIAGLFEISVKDMTELWLKEYSMQKDNIKTVKKRSLK